MSKKESTVDDLARMVADGFREVGERFAELQRDVDVRFEIMREENKKHFGLIERNQEDLKFRLDNVPYRFELKDVETRVEHLEDRAKI